MSGFMLKSYLLVFQGRAKLLNSVKLYSHTFCGNPNTAQQRTLVCPFFRGKCTQAFIYRSSDDHCLRSSHRWIKPCFTPRHTNRRCSHLATARARLPAEANCKVKLINSGRRLGAHAFRSSRTAAQGAVLRGSVPCPLLWLEPRRSPEHPAGTPRAAPPSGLSQRFKAVN